MRRACPEHEVCRSIVSKWLELFFFGAGIHVASGATYRGPGLPCGDHTTMEWCWERRW